MLATALTPLIGGNGINLYLKDGESLLVREYEILQDRIRYYSTERSSWEEIPLTYVDLEKTNFEKDHIQQIREERKKNDRIERIARRKAHTELHQVPLEDGVYCLQNKSIQQLEQAEVNIVINKKTKVLKSLLPIFLEKSTLEIKDVQSLFPVRDRQPIFYVRLEEIKQIMLVRLTDKNGKPRIVQHILKTPKKTETYEEQDEIEVFRQQLAPTVYKIWPTNPMKPGNYALIEFTRGMNNTRVWSFVVEPTPKQPEA